MPSFLVESQLVASPVAFDDACRRAQLVCERDARIRCVRTTLLPGAGTVMHVFEAPSLQALAAAGALAALRYDRIVQWSDDLGDDPREEKGT